jgi:hypothetical protein
MNTAETVYRFCGQDITREQLSLIREVTGTCGGLSATEVSHTVCELLDWKRAGGGLKWRECMDLLELLEGHGELKLPEKRQIRRKKTARRIAAVPESEPWSALVGSVETFAPVEVDLVENREQRRLFGDLLRGHHYLGYAMPYGARLQYLAYVSRPSRQVVGCVQFSSPAWRIKARDQWIGWDDVTRGKRLQHIVNNSRFLVLPRIDNLASKILSSVLRRLRSDWKERYGVDPWLAETLVDRARYHGGCYRAANWITLGETSGRGRMDRTHARHGACVKTLMVYPLVRDAAARLTQAHGG